MFDFILYHPDGMVPYYTGYIPSESTVCSTIIIYAVFSACSFAYKPAIDFIEGFSIAICNCKDKKAHILTRLK